MPLLYTVLANHPALFKAWTDLAWPLRSDPTVERALRELLILRVAQLTASEYEWAHHWPLAAGAGVREAQLSALADWESSAEFDGSERAALAFTDQLVGSGHVDDDVFVTLRETFGAAAVVQIAMTASFYVCVARMGAAFDLQLEPAYQAMPPLDPRCRLT